MPKVCSFTEKQGVFQKVYKHVYYDNNTRGEGLGRTKREARDRAAEDFWRKKLERE